MHEIKSMIMKNHVVSLDFSKKLYDNGWKKETEFRWVKINEILFEDKSCSWKQTGIKEGEWKLEWKLELGSPKGFQNGDMPMYFVYSIISAPLATEILEELPQGITIRKGWGIKNDYVMFDNEANEILSDKSLPNALAKMWINLKKNNLIKKNTKEGK